MDLIALKGTVLWMKSLFTRGFFFGRVEFTPPFFPEVSLAQCLQQQVSFLGTERVKSPLMVPEDSMQHMKSDTELWYLLSYELACDSIQSFGQNNYASLRTYIGKPCFARKRNVSRSYIVFKPGGENRTYPYEQSYKKKNNSVNGPHN